MAPVDAHALAAPGRGNKEIEEWSNEVEEVTSQIRGIIDGTITDFEAFDQQLALKERAKQIRQEESQARRQKFLLNGSEGKGEGTKYKWWCKRCFVEYLIDLPEGKCTRCQQSDKLMSQEARREELMGKLEVFKEEKAKHKWRKDKWGRWKKSQALLGKSRFINYKAWEYWEPDTDSEEEGDPIVPRDNPEFLAMEADLKERKRKQSEKNLTAERCRQRGNQCMKEGDYVGAIENYEEGLEYRRDCKALWTNKALAEVKVFRWHDAIGSCNKVIEYAEIFEEGFAKSADACFKAFTRRATALRGLHKWEDALNDLEDALTIFPKNKEAQDLLEKTKLACQQARNGETCEDRRQEEEDGPVRVEIEESDESEAEGPEAESIDAPPDSLGQLSKSEFGQLLKSLESAAERSVFCARPGEFSGQTKPKADQWVGRKIDLKVDEVAQPSRLDGVLKDIERSCILWKKRRPNADGRRAMQDDEPESKDADAFVELVVPRALSVLLALADNDHHCSLTAPALRHVWPMLLVEDWRYQILSLLHEWSSRSITVRSMAEFASRYPEHVQLLIDIVASERKEDALPPGFEDSAKKMADKLGLGADLAVAEVRKALLRKSPVELAILGLGNLCSQGASLSHFKDQISGYVAPMVAALRRHLRPMDWRCGAAAGALCNLLRLGKAAAEEVEKCSELLLTALREEAKPEVMASLKAMQGADCGVQLATSRLLGALVNLVVVQPGALVGLQQMGALEVAAGLIDPEAYSSAPESEALVVSTRACLLSAKLVATSPDLSAELETGILRHVQQILEKVTFSTESLETVDPPVRLLVTLVTKIPGAVDRFLSSSFPLAKLSELLQALLPGTHLAPEDEAGTASRLRGNLSLLFGVLSEQQAAGAVPDLDLSPQVAIFVEMLRRERGAAQHNLGVCVTKLAQNPRYRDQVRELNGLESLHQIQLPKVNAQKEKERKMHRLETSAEDRRREILRRRA
ncbi:unnamed protein product [Effrenium voratum]|uniref:Uncharacterized protein n=1 Tax=Effrenium voratum TaxID=2562239 RepID=A0AA36N620_9DINO|nr:unnamed protein product [Effrenium voratum]